MVKQSAKRKPNGFDSRIMVHVSEMKAKRSRLKEEVDLKLLKEKDKSYRQKAIFDIADKIYEDVYNYSLVQIAKYADHEILRENTSTEVISFLMNIYTKVLCHGFMDMIRLKRKKIKENDSTKEELLKEVLNGICAMLGGEAVFEEQDCGRGEIKQLAARSAAKELDAEYIGFCDMDQNKETE
jgi:hypothetical protein